MKRQILPLSRNVKDKYNPSCARECENTYNNKCQQEKSAGRYHFFSCITSSWSGSRMKILRCVSTKQKKLAYALPRRFKTSQQCQLECIGSCFVSGPRQCEMGYQLCQKKSHKICVHQPRIQISVLALKFAECDKYKYYLLGSKTFWQIITHLPMS